jgi:alkanesulfonate monooxygenase SsuD/methylene tetrahydromethanopterin reductase-like flavin-dependent oxidoreductase (luciferase family)
MAGGIPQQQGGAYMQEMLPAVRALWRGDYQHDGALWQFPPATAVPKPLQRPHPPIWIGGNGPNRTLPLVARYADVWHAWGTPNSLLEANERVDQLATEAGRDPSSIMRANSLSLDDLDTARKHAGKWRDAGYGYLICGWPDAGRPQVERFAREVMPDFS